MLTREIAMSFDLLSTIELTASAALVVAVLTFTLAATRRGRIEAAALLAAWFAVVVFLGATRALDQVGATFERISVPGSLEIPTAIAIVRLAVTVPPRSPWP